MIFWGAIMSMYSIYFSTSPSQLLARRFNQFTHIDVAENPGIQQSKPEINQPVFSRNPEKLVENQVVTGIAKAVGTDTGSTAKVNSTDFTPEKVADRILAYVNQAHGQLKNNAPNFDQATFFCQIKQGIDTGFSEARNALCDLGALNGQPQKNMDATYAKIQEGLSRLESGAQAADVAATATVSQQQGFSAQASQTAEIEIVTKEGDVIKIRLAQSATNSYAAVNIEQGGVIATAVQSNAENSSKFSVSIQGNLNEDEQKSLKNLLNQMDSVGHDFFNGNIRDAFDHAQQIGLDTKQIASFSMNLSLEKSVQAVTAYQQVSFPDQQIEPDKIKQAANFSSQMRDLLKTAQSALMPFENPLSAYNDLFNAALQVGTGNGTEQPKAVPDNLALQQIIKPLGETVLTEQPTNV
jgi:hypothetical protein